MTWYKIYRLLCMELNILYPLKQSELCVRVNSIPNSLEFHKRNLSKITLSDNLDELADVYYRLMKDIGFSKFCEISLPIFNYRCKEYPDRIININTILSVLYLSGYKGDYLYDKCMCYIRKYSIKEN